MDDDDVYEEPRVSALGTFRQHPRVVTVIAVMTTLLFAAQFNFWRGSSDTLMDGTVLVPHGIPGSVVNKPPVADASAISKMSYPGYPECQARLDWMKTNWNKTPESFRKYRAGGVDGSMESILNYLNQNGLYCPAAHDAVKPLIRGVNIGGWLVLEPWLTPSLFEQFDPVLGVKDQWTFCEVLGKEECRKQLEAHWDKFLTEDDVKELAAGEINHVRIPVGYWIMGDIRPDEPWVNGDLFYLQRAMYWFRTYNLSVMFDLHCAPGSQNGFDNSGRAGGVHFADPSQDAQGQTFYANIDRTLTVLEALVSLFALPPFHGVVKYVELVNEAFITIPLPVVKEFYTRGYQAIRNIDPNIGIVIGDSFRFGDWNNFMYPPTFNHVYIDTHIYYVFDAFRLGQTWDQHVDFTCQSILPVVAIAPLSTIVGEWSLATTDCAKWLNGAWSGSRYDGTFQNSEKFGSCEGQNDMSNKKVWTPEYRQFLSRFFAAQVEAYESGSAMGWFFWNFKTEDAPQWNYLLGLKEGWIPKVLKTGCRKAGCKFSDKNGTAPGVSYGTTPQPSASGPKPRHPPRLPAGRQQDHSHHHRGTSAPIASKP